MVILQDSSEMKNTLNFTHDDVDCFCQLFIFLSLFGTPLRLVNLKKIPNNLTVTNDLQVSASSKQTTQILNEKINAHKTFSCMKVRKRGITPENIPPKK